MTITYNCDTLELLLTDPIFALGNTLEVKMNDTVQTGTVDTILGTYTISNVTKDKLFDITVTDTVGTTITKEIDCYFTNCETLCNITKQIKDKGLDSSESTDMLVYYYALTSSQNCACECENLKIIESALSNLLNDCPC